MARNQISNKAMSTEIGFFPTMSWDLTEDDFGLAVEGPGSFNWIQAFFDATQVTEPRLVAWNGESYLADKVTPLCSYVRFAYSGEMKPFKGCVIFEEGTNVRGDALTSSGISNGATDINIVTAYGGTQ